MYIMTWVRREDRSACASAQSGPKVIKLLSCSTQLSMKLSLLINMNMAYLLAEKFSCSAMFSQKEFAVVSNFRFIIRTNFMLS